MFSKAPVKKMRILFVDEKNDTTSQLAEYFATREYPDLYEVYSAGPEHDIVDCDLISVMYRAGEDMREQVAKDFKDEDHLPTDNEYDLVIYTDKKVFDEWAPRTPWQGKQILQDMGAVRDFTATDDVEQDQCYTEMIERVRSWVKTEMEDPEKLKALVSA